VKRTAVLIASAKLRDSSLPFLQEYWFCGKGVGGVCSQAPKYSQPQASYPARRWACSKGVCLPGRQVGAG
jgi:hypothetical protein